MTNKLELKSSHEVIDTVDVADVESIFYCKPTDPDILTVLMKDGKRLYCDEVCTLQEENQNDDLEEASNNTLDKILEKYDIVNIKSCLEMFRLGAEWQKEQFEKDYTNLCNGIATVKGLVVAMTYNKGVADTKEQMMKNIWKDAQGDDLPEYEREVVVFTQNFPDNAGIMMVAIGHRPTPEGYDGKSLATGEIKHYTPKTYDKGGWNIPDVKYWLDVELPKEIEL